jgi:hypothetical protein
MGNVTIINRQDLDRLLAHLTNQTSNQSKINEKRDTLKKMSRSDQKMREEEVA